MLGHHSELIQGVQHDLAAGWDSFEHLSEQLVHLSFQASPSAEATSPAAGKAAAVASMTPGDSYAGDPEPFYVDLNQCRGFLLQCQLVFSQRSRLFASDEAKINYIIGLLQGKGAWAQASSSGAPQLPPS